MDVTPYLELKPAPVVLFEALEERRARPRFMLPTDGGDWRAVTWGAFADQVRDLALYLRGLELGEDARAAIFAPNRVEWMSAALAIQAAHGVMVPIYPASTVDQAAYVIEHSDAQVIFVDTEPLLERLLCAWPRLSAVARIITLDDGLDPLAVLARVRGQGHERLPTTAELEAKLIPWTRAAALGRARSQEHPGELEEMLGSIDLDHPAVMLYTSGTTGNPKGVPLTHRNVGVNGRDWLLSNASLVDEGAVDLLWLPMSHIFGFGEACLGNTLGFVTYMSDPAAVLGDLPRVKPTVFMSVPAYWQKIASLAMAETDVDARRRRLAELTGGRLRFCLSGGAGLEKAVKELYHACGLLIIEGYGLTECSPTLTLNRPDAFRFDAVGRPLPSVELRLADDGEILARGESVFSGYHKDPAATAEAFTADGWFKTGDVGRFTDDGFLQIVDRKKEILVTAGGKNVPPANIELRFANNPIFQHVVVYGDGKKYLVAGVWLSPEAVDAELSRRGTPSADRPRAIAELVQRAIDEVNTELARFEQIKRHRIMDTPLTVARGLLTSTLKVRRKRVYEAFASELEGLYD